MKSATFLTFDPRFADVVAGVLVARGAQVYGDIVQVLEDGPDRGLFTYYGKDDDPDLEWEVRDPPWAPADGVEMPDMATVDTHYVECRFEIQFAEIAKELAEASDQPLWVMDSNRVVWDAAAVDPERILL